MSTAPARESGPDAGARDISPLAILVFCPHCFFTGVFAAAAAGLITLPTVFGVGLEWVLPPLIIVGGFLTWLWWGRREARKAAASPGPPRA